MAMTCFACTNWQIMASSMYVFHTELIMWRSSCGNVGFHIKEVCGNRWHIADWQGQQLEFPGVQGIEASVRTVNLCWLACDTQGTLCTVGTTLLY